MQTRKHLSIERKRCSENLGSLKKKIGEKRKLIKKNNPRNPPIFWGFPDFLSKRLREGFLGFYSVKVVTYLTEVWG